MSQAPPTKGERLQHQRYKDGREETITYVDPKPIDYKVCRFPLKVTPIPVEELRSALVDKPDMLEALNQRLRNLESLISMEFDAETLHVAALYTRKVRHGSKYLNEVSPSYCYVTLKEHHGTPGGFRAANGHASTLCMPLYLTPNHGASFHFWFRSTFSKLANVTMDNHTGKWHELWVPDTVAHLINQTIVDFAREQVLEAGIQFVLDAQRLLVYCCEATGNGDHGALLFPNMLLLMRKFLLDFIYHPQYRTRDNVPDLGDILQWLSVVELLDNTITWKKDLVHAVIVELMRRQARWVGNHLVQKYGFPPGVIRKRTAQYQMVPHRHKPGQMFQLWKYEYSRETRAQLLLRCIKEHMSLKKELLDLWWDQIQVGARVVLYSHAFYSYFFEDKTLEEFKAKYDPVLGAAYPEDYMSIKTARGEIGQVGSLSDLFARLGYPMSNDDIYRLCIWAIEAEEGYDKVGRPDPLADGWKSFLKPKQQQQKNQTGVRKSTKAVMTRVEQASNDRLSNNRFASLEELDDWDGSWDPRLRNRRNVVVSMPGR
jgi:hypothetical protein